MAEFSEIRFPEHISYGSVGGPGFKTSVVTTGSGREQRNSQWQKSRAKYDAVYAVREEDDMHQVIKFFYARRGMAVGFRFKDWNDYTIINQNFGVGDGANKVFQMFKRYESGSDYYDRVIQKIVPGSIVSIDVNGIPLAGSGWSVDNNTGIITLVVAPAVAAIVSVSSLEFDVPVRFDMDDLPVSADDWNQSSVSSIPLIELRL